MKKALKIILGIVVLLLFCFLTAGLIVPSVDYETSISVNVGIDEAFEKYNDLNQISEWIPEIKSVKPLNVTPNKIGSEFEMVVESGGQTITMIETVNEYVENEKVGFSFDAGNMIKTDQTYFSGDSTTTTIKGVHSCKGANYLHRCMFAFFKSMFIDIDQQYMNQFKAWIEKSED